MLVCLLKEISNYVVLLVVPSDFHADGTQIICSIHTLIMSPKANQKEQSELINSTTRLEMSLCTHLHEMNFQILFIQ